MTRDQRMFMGLITAVIIADTEKELENNNRRNINDGKKKFMSVRYIKIPTIRWVKYQFANWCRKNKNIKNTYN